MSDAIETLRGARHVVVQDYPDRDIPDSLTRAGFAVTIYGGPDPADIVVSELVDGAVVHRQTGRRPDSADLLYVYRPLAEIDGILADAQRLGVRTIWRQPDVVGGPDPDADAWRTQVEAAGITYLDAPAINDVARLLMSDR
jgi:predicted CoA-binding protein